jgi:energy-coupling factor transporter ATP-binding protein EcfA2
MAHSTPASGLSVWTSQGSAELRLRTFRANAGAHYRTCTHSAEVTHDRVLPEEFAQMAHNILLAGAEEGSKVVILVRGSPGMGKSTLGECLQMALEAAHPDQGRVILAQADDFMTTIPGPRGVEYLYDSRRVVLSHRYTQRILSAFLSSDETDVESTLFMQSGPYSTRFLVVANTFTQDCELEPYWLMARQAPSAPKMVFIDLFSLFWARGPTWEHLGLPDQGHRSILERFRNLPNVHAVPQAQIRAMVGRYRMQRFYFEVYQRTQGGAEGTYSRAQSLEAPTSSAEWTGNFDSFFRG